MKSDIHAMLKPHEKTRDQTIQKPEIHARLDFPEKQARGRIASLSVEPTAGYAFGFPKKNETKTTTSITS